MYRRNPKPKRRAAAAILIAAATGVTAAPAASSAAPVPTSHTLNLSFLQDPGQPPDPAVYYAGQGLLLQDNIYQGLVQYEAGTPDRAIVPDLATSWTVSSDARTYTFQLRKAVLFHDGTPFNSSAVGPSVKRDAAVGGGPAYMADAVESVQTKGPYTAVIELKQPNTAFLDYLASAYGPRMYSPTGLAKYAGKNNDQTYLATHDLGTGPYYLTEAKVGIAYQMKAFPQYWGKKPYYTTVNMPVIDNLDTEEVEFQSGKIDAILHDLTAQAVKGYLKDPSYNVYSLPTLESQYAYINPADTFLTTPANRRALLEAIDQRQLYDVAYRGRGSIGEQVYPRNLVPSSMSAQDITYNPAPLKKIVASLPTSDKKFTIGYDSGSSDGQLLASLITIQLDEDGLSAQSIGYPTGTLYSWPPPGSDKGAPEMVIEYVWPDAYDPYQWADIAFTPTGGINWLHCTVPGSQDQLNQAVSNNATALFGKVGDEAFQSGCYMNLMDQNDVVVAQKWLQGIPQSHVVAAPYALQLEGLYPGKPIAG
jgi:peptide/nickel transport system substrate-binding protein